MNQGSMNFSSRFRQKHLARSFQVGGSVTLVCLLGMLALGRVEPQIDDSPKAVARWIDFVDSIARKDSQLSRATGKAIQAVPHPYPEDVSAQISSSDYVALQLARKTGCMERETALGIFQIDSLLTWASRPEPPDSVEVKWLYPASTIQPGDLEMVLVDGSNFDSSYNIYFLQDDCFLGKAIAMQHYEFLYGGGEISGGRPVVWHSSNNLHGLGLYDQTWQFYTVVDQHLVLAGTQCERMYQSNPVFLNRHVSGEIISTHPLRIGYHWEVWLGYNFRTEAPSFRGSAVIEYGWDQENQCIIPLGSPSRKIANKIRALGFDAESDLFVLSWKAELKAALRSRSAQKRQEAIEWLEEMY